MLGSNIIFNISLVVIQSIHTSLDFPCSEMASLRSKIFLNQNLWFSQDIST